MSWKVVVRPEVEQDMAKAVAWYESQQSGLGLEFMEEVFQIWDALADNPFLSCRRHPIKNIRWRYPERFPYRVVYEALEEERTVIVAAVIHAARHESYWQRRI